MRTAPGTAPVKLRGLAIKFLSAVDRPAHEGAEALLLKQAPTLVGDDDEEKAAADQLKALHRRRRKKLGKGTFDGVLYAESIAKHAHSDQIKKDFDSTPVVMTGSIDGHSHLVWLNARAGTTTWQKSEGEEGGHDHPWMLMLDDAGGFTLEIGDSEGHTHTVDARAVNAAFASAALSKEEKTMPEPKKTEKSAEEVTEIETNLTLSRLFSGLNDAERAYFVDLGTTEKAAFIVGSHDDRATEIEKAVDATDVVYTDRDGLKYTKSDDARLIALAKRGDKDAKRAEASETKLADADLSKRAETVLKHYPGKPAVHVSLLRAVDKIEDEAERTGVMEALTAGDKAIAVGFSELGSGGGENPEGGDAEAKLNAAAKRISEEKGISFAKAYRDFSTNTEEGRALYAETLS